MRTKNEFTVFPSTVVVDTREKSPFAFAGLRADATAGGGQLVITLKAGTLSAGDYSLEGFTDRIAVERKSLSDLFGTLSAGRERFVRELERLSSPPMEFAAVVVEADWTAILHHPPRHSSLAPKVVMRSVIAWQQRFPRVHWWMMPDRRHAEIATFRILERWWRNVKKALV